MGWWCARTLMCLSCRSISSMSDLDCASGLPSCTCNNKRAAPVDMSHRHARRDPCIPLLQGLSVRRHLDVTHRQGTCSSLVKLGQTCDYGGAALLRRQVREILFHRLLKWRELLIGSRAADNVRGGDIGRVWRRCFERARVCRCDVGLPHISACIGTARATGTTAATASSTASSCFCCDAMV